MSDPYDHGETCDCEKCIAFSEGFEAGASITPPMDPKSIVFYFQTESAAREFVLSFKGNRLRPHPNATGLRVGIEDCTIFDVNPVEGDADG